MGWVVIDTQDQGVHVLPVSPSGEVACGHAPVITCSACVPTPVRNGPLDDVTWSHQQPDWPGATVGWVS